jgi:PPOX class probable F420-dependent enzyme
MFVSLVSISKAERCHRTYEQNCVIMHKGIRTSDLFMQVSERDVPNSNYFRESRRYNMAFQLPDPATPFGERVARRLRDERLIWFTTVDAKGTPQPTPVWFLWDEATSTILMYSRADAKRLAHIQQNPRVAFNLDGNGNGGDIIVITGEAQVSPGDPPADQLPVYVKKYRDFITRSYQRPERFAEMYSVALRIRPIAIRGH